MSGNVLLLHPPWVLDHVLVKWNSGRWQYTWVRSLINLGMYAGSCFPWFPIGAFQAPTKAAKDWTWDFLYAKRVLFGWATTLPLKTLLYVCPYVIHPATHNLEFGMQTWGIRSPWQRGSKWIVLCWELFCVMGISFSTQGIRKKNHTIIFLHCGY